MAEEKEGLVTETCCGCGVVFGMSPAHHARRKYDCDTYYCPNGHGQHFTKPSTDPKDTELVKLRADLATATALAEKLQKELDETRLDLEIWKPSKAGEKLVLMSDQKVGAST